MRRRIVEGQVVDKNGMPVAGAFVTIQAFARHTDFASITSQEGKFRLELPEGDFSVHAVTRTGKKAVKNISKFNNKKFSPIINFS